MASSLLSLPIIGGDVPETPPPPFALIPVSSSTAATASAAAAAGGVPSTAADAAAALPLGPGGRYRQNVDIIRHARYETETKHAECRKAARRDEAFPGVTARKWAALSALHHEIAFEE